MSESVSGGCGCTAVALDHLLACEDWDGKADCVYRGEDPDDWCDACTARVEELPKLLALIRAEARRAAIEECAEICDQKARQALRLDCAPYRDCRDALRSLLSAEANE